jgi:hypothetical protein
MLQLEMSKTVLDIHLLMGVERRGCVLLRLRLLDRGSHEML